MTTVVSLVKSEPSLSSTADTDDGDVNCTISSSLIHSILVGAEAMP